MPRTCTLAILFTLSLMTLSAGCAVPQPRGEGLYQYVKEPTTGAGYHLYLPKDYVKNNGRHPNPSMKRWPLVMTFHGMKPYDNALPQEREWEKEADFYGYIVCAPELNTSDSFMEYPLTKEHDYVLADRKNVLAIMDHIGATTLADQKRVLSTSWSCGGYLAHYFPNRFPERFSCIATRLSNFSPSLLIEETVPRYKDRLQVAIFIGDGDFAACKSESEVAVAWYTARGFRVRGKMIDNMGHSRIPQTAAAFFAETLGIEPLHPKEAAATVAQVQMTEYTPPQALIAQVSPTAARPSFASAQPQVTPPTPRPVTPPPAAARPPETQPPRQQTVAYTNRDAGRNYPTNARPPYDPSPRRDQAQPAVALGPTGNSAATQAPPANDRGNWLAANRTEPAREPAASTPPRPAPTSVASAQPAAAKPAPTKASPPPRVTTPPPTQRPPATAKPATVADASSTRRQSTPPPPVRSSARGDSERRYGPTRTGDTPPSAANSAAARRSEPTNNRVASTPPRQPPAEPAPRRSGARVRRANIKLSGPVIGTSPHYLAYSVDLPRDEIEGADFLWMDNGVWIGDEPRGVKILESPGVHRISVLIVTRDNTEYRGSTTVQVLDRSPTAAAN